MKLFVTIPALNESASISAVIKSIPRKIPGISSVKVMVWSDGSTDNTVEVAKAAGSDYVFSNKKNLGLARTFDLATARAVELGADIVVNTDADNQYDQAQMVSLTAPIVAGKADVVNGNRQVNTLAHMPSSKKYGNRLGSWTIRWLTGLNIQDASSGFRAYTAEAIRQLTIFSKHTYTHETLIQIAFGDLSIVEVPVTFKARPEKAGRSRLVSNIFTHISKSASTIIRTVLMYKALKVFVILGVIELSLALLLGARYLWIMFAGLGGSHIQSLILASMLFNMGLVSLLIGIISDLIAVNRKINAKLLK